VIRSKISRSLLKFDFPLSNPRTVGAVDCGYERGGRRLGAVIVVFDLNSGELLEEVRSLAKIFIPYIPGFLNFREAPVIIKAWRQLRIKPDVLLVDGNWINRPLGALNLLSFPIKLREENGAVKFPITTRMESKWDYAFAPGVELNRFLSLQVTKWISKQRGRLFLI